MWKILTLLCLSFLQADSFKILVYSSKFGYSHMNYMGRVADTLHEAGHNVTVLQPMVDPSSRGTGVNKAKVIEIDDPTPVAATNKEEFFKVIWNSNVHNPFGVVMPAYMLAVYFRRGLENALDHTEILAKLREENFDLLIGEMFDYGGFAIAQELGIKKVVCAHSSIMMETTPEFMGLPAPESYIPGTHGLSDDSGTFFNRLSNTFYSIFSRRFETLLIDAVQEVVDERRPNFKKIEDVIRDAPLIITNAEPLLDFPRPTFNTIVDLGGIGLKTPKKLDAEWDAILNKRAKNFLISFGSVAPSHRMPLESKQMLVKVMKKFPDVTFIWKYETPEDGIVEQIDNLHLTKWTPQTDLLGDSRLSAFLTHGGAGSSLESLFTGTPTIVVPLFGEQVRNAKMITRQNCGIMLAKYELQDEQILEDAFRKILNDETIASSVQVMSRMLHKRPFSSKEKLIKSIEFAAEFGDKARMNAAGRHFTTVQYYNLDIYALIAVFFVLILLFVSRIVRRIFCHAISMGAKQKLN